MPILKWPDIIISSPEYNFLKDIGVKEFPALSLLVERIIVEHHEKYKPEQIIDYYEPPKALEFFVMHFQVAYAIDWTRNSFITKKMLPSYPPKNLMQEKAESYIMLTAANELSSIENPLFSYILPEVKVLIEKHFELKLLGVVEYPSVSMGFKVLMERRNEILTDETAPSIFSYMNHLGYIDSKHRCQLQNDPFIPLRGILNQSMINLRTCLFINVF